MNHMRCEFQFPCLVFPTQYHSIAFEHLTRDETLLIKYRNLSENISEKTIKTSKPWKFSHLFFNHSKPHANFSLIFSDIAISIYLLLVLMRRDIALSVVEKLISKFSDNFAPFSINTVYANYDKLVDRVLWQTTVVLGKMGFMEIDGLVETVSCAVLVGIVHLRCEKGKRNSWWR
jgi:hypothetical protein